MSDGYFHGRTNPLVGYWTKKEGDLDYRTWMATSLTSTFDVKKFFEDQPKHYDNIHRNLVRGYRTSNTTASLEDIFVKTFREGEYEWAMSYIGKAEMKVYLPDADRRRLKDAITSVTELMENSNRVHIENWNGHLRIRAPASAESMETRLGKRKVPVIEHQFQQVRPLVIKALTEAAPIREVVIYEWRCKPKFSIYL